MVAVGGRVIDLTALLLPIAIGQQCFYKHPFSSTEHFGMLNTCALCSDLLPWKMFAQYVCG